ncbi:hypothetical protein PILCRDRAFT_823099 [Piloderma croceum F 1598]|uniref:Uncharacterized protein n=1 Tax=Piloderma croceum (strain F 1598) TaxID=765440 RepID=A0A0C3FJE9_PILCF|nr:hypothetical protein PILCRDRAFT_823099 [Piloderma croceum F 1598]
MANLVRSAKSGSSWGMNELIAFNIEVIDVNAQTFFGNAILPQLTLSPVILDNLEEPAGPLHKADMDFFAYMEDAMIIPPGEESLVDDFAAFVLKMMRYDEGRRVIHLRKEMGFEMCGQRVDAKTDVCVMERSGTGAKYLLLVQEDKRHLSRDDPEPQLIAEAIAAFYENNRARKAAGLPKLPSRTFAGITMIGTAPTFYKIPVTDELLISLATSQYPTQVTTVTKLVPPVPFPERLANDGMKPLVNRRIILQCFDAFRQFLN